MVTAYAQNFFEQSGVELEPSLAAILSGSFRLLSSLIAPLVLMRAPKKTLFVACGAVREAIEVVLRYESGGAGSRSQYSRTRQLYY